MCTARGQKNEPITIKPVTNIMKQMAIVISSFNLDALDQFGQIVSLLYTSSPNHPQVVDLMCFLAKGNRSGYDKQTSLKNVVECFVANLPKVMMSKDVTSMHLQTIQLLLRRHDIVLLSAINKVLPTLLGNIADTIPEAGGSNKAERDDLVPEILRTIALVSFNSTESNVLKDIRNIEDWRERLLRIVDSIKTDSNITLSSTCLFREAIMCL